MARTGITADMVGILAAPTPRDEIKQRQGPGGRMLDYVDARFVMDRLDEIGGENWQDQFVDRADGAVRCGIGVLVDGEWVWKWDVGTASDIEPEKGSYSEAFKRAGVKWGIARDLYGHATTSGRGGGRATTPAPASPQPRPAATPPSPVGGLPEEPDWVMGQEVPAAVVGRPVAPSGGDECPMHHLAWILQPGGVSKAGKAYEAFWKCPGKTDGTFCKEKPNAAWSARHEVAA